MKLKLFGKTFFEKESTVAAEPEANDGKMSFSTPFLKITKGSNLGTPFISPYYTVSGIVQFGSDNLYPQILDQMYYTSPIHSDCIDFKVQAAIGGGYEWKIPPRTGPEKVDLLTFERINEFNKMFRYLPVDFVIHKRVCVLIKKDANGCFKSMTRLHPSTIRNNQDITKFLYCKDWSKRTGLIEYNKYTPNGKDLESIYVYHAESVGQDVYPLPSYISVLNDVFLDGEISFLQKSNIENSIWPSLGVRIPKLFASNTERDEFKDSFVQNTGAKGGGKVMFVQGQGMENTPEFVPIPTNQNDKLFDSTIDNVFNKICFSHGINPSIMGIKVSGSLGNAQELEASYSIFEKNIIMPLRAELTEIFDKLLDIACVRNSIVINDYQIISGGATSATEEPSLADKLGIGGTQTLVSILANPTLSNEQKISSVQVLYNLPADKAKLLVYGEGVSAPKAAPVAEAEMSKEPVATNEALRNMTGKQQQQLVRIIRQYGQGKISKEVAAIQLKNGFGLSDEDIKLMLTETEEV